MMSDVIWRLQNDVTALDAEEGEIRNEIHSVIDGFQSLLERKRSELLAKADVYIRKKQNDLRQGKIE